MNWSKYLSYTLKTGFKKQDTLYYRLTLNEIIISDLQVVSKSLHIATYNLLTKYKKPQYHIAYLMRRKKGFHTLFFQQNYDVIVCDRYGNVLKAFNNQTPGFISPYFKDAYFIYFMVVGSIKHYNINASDRLTLKPVLLTWKLIEDAIGIN